MAAESISVTGGTAWLVTGHDVSTATLDQSGGSIRGNGKLQATGAMNWTGGSIGDLYNPTYTIVEAKGGVKLTGGAKSMYSGTVINSGSGTITGNYISFYNNSAFSNAVGSTFDRHRYSCDQFRIVCPRPSRSSHGPSLESGFQ